MGIGVFPHQTTPVYVFLTSFFTLPILNNFKQSYCMGAYVKATLNTDTLEKLNNDKFYTVNVLYQKSNV